MKVVSAIECKPRGVAVVILAFLLQALTVSFLLAGGGTPTLVWVSMDGVRPDYLERTQVPFLQGLIKDGDYCDRVIPCFPSITFPNHASMVTGVHPEEHGIVANVFYDRGNDRMHSYPWSDQWLLAEPIWRAATRQGLEVAVFDWPLSHDQQGEYAARYYGHRYNSALDGKQRLDQVLDAYRDSIEQGRPLQLLMGYLPEPDTSGHRYGPESQNTILAFEQSIEQLEAFYRAVHELWHDKVPSSDSLILLVTSDHGMAAVEHVVNPAMITGLEEREDLLMIGAGNILQIYCKRGTGEDDIERLGREIKDALGEYDFATLYHRSELPRQWHYDHPQRTADFVVVLQQGYAWSRRSKQPVAAVDTVGGPLGMHGYPPADEPQMHTVALLHVESGVPQVTRLPASLSVVDLYGVVCDLLGIEKESGVVSSVEK